MDDKLEELLQLTRENNTLLRAILVKKKIALILKNYCIIQNEVLSL